MLSTYGAKNWQDMLKTANKANGYEPNMIVKFWRSYSSVLLLMLLCETKEGNWKLHRESVKDLCKYSIAHDRLNYSQMVSLYLAQFLESTDPHISEIFMSGDFCVNNNDIPFCSIGPGHAILALGDCPQVPPFSNYCDGWCNNHVLSWVWWTVYLVVPE